MRIAIAVLCLSAIAHADKRITDMTPGFEREAQTCATQVSGLEKVQAGGAAIAPSLSPEDKAQLDTDLAALADGLAGVKAYCAEVTGLVELLKANAAASYRSVEKELDERDNKVRKLRKQSKATIEALAPITRRWIGRIAQQQTRQEPSAPKPKRVTFPSGRKVDLPALPGTWKIGGTAKEDTLEYAETGWSATISVRSGIGPSCQQEFDMHNPAPSNGGLPKTDLNIGWAGVIVTKAAKTYIEMICVNNMMRETPGGGWLGTIEAHPGAPSKLTELRELELRMIQLPKP